MIYFNVSPVTGDEMAYIGEAIESRLLAGDGRFTKMCEAWFEKRLSTPTVLMTTSCTHALEMAAMLIGIEPGDEVIMPSYTFVSTANAFVIRGAKIVFVDVRPDTMNIDETLIEGAITPRTKAIVPVHYAGVGCDMETIMDIATRHGLFVVEDAAQGMMSTYAGKPLGAIGHLGTYSFHATKNYTSGGEGGLLIINDEKLVDRAQIIREKGTNRNQFFRGMVDKYSWVDVGSSYLPSEIQAAYLWAQLQHADAILADRMNSWQAYDRFFRASPYALEVPTIPEACIHNAHMYYIKVKDLEERRQLIDHMRDQEINAVFHYVPLHSSSAGRRFGHFQGEDRYTTKESERLLRLPLYFNMTGSDLERVCEQVDAFFK